MNIKILKKLTLVYLLVVLTLTMVFGVLFTFGVNMQGNGMGDCIFNKQSICEMSVTEHISLWQGTMTAIPQEAIGLFSLLLSIVFSLLFFRSFLLLLFDSRTKLKLYQQSNPDYNLFNYLKRIFSQGILNPKIYEVILA